MKKSFLSFSVQDLKKLEQLLKRQRGFDLSFFRPSLVERKIMIHMRHLGVKTWQEFLDYLAQHPKEMDQIISKLSIKVSQFFRNQSFYQCLTERVLRPLSLDLHGSKRICRIMSLGCAAGQEPYSLAMLAYGIFPAGRVEILALDVDSGAVHQARMGQYTPDQIKNIPAPLLAKYFVKDRASESWQIKDIIGKMVRFQRADAFQLPLSPKMDLILCRNLMIFYTREKQNQLLKNMRNCLKHRGYLVIGKSETLIGGRKKGLLSISSQERIYQKSN